MTILMSLYLYCAAANPGYVNIDSRKRCQVYMKQCVKSVRYGNPAERCVTDWEDGKQ